MVLGHHQRGPCPGRGQQAAPQTSELKPVLFPRLPEKGSKVRLHTCWEPLSTKWPNAKWEGVSESWGCQTKDRRPGAETPGLDYSSSGTGCLRGRGGHAGAPAPGSVLAGGRFSRAVRLCERLCPGLPFLYYPSPSEAGPILMAFHLSKDAVSPYSHG